MLKRNTKENVMENIDCWKTYEKIMDSQIEGQDYGECTEYDEMLDIFMHLGGYKFCSI